MAGTPLGGWRLDGSLQPPGGQNLEGVRGFRVAGAVQALPESLEPVFLAEHSGVLQVTSPEHVPVSGASWLSSDLAASWVTLMTGSQGLAEEGMLGALPVGRTDQPLC